MKRLFELRTLQIMIFPTDDLCYSSFQNGESISLIEKKYNLKFARMPELLAGPNNVLVFNNGIYKHKEERFIIEQLTIEERRIIIHLCGPSEIITDFFSDLKSILLELDFRKEKGTYEPLITTNETSAIVKLDFHINQLFEHSPILTFSEDLKSKIPCFESDLVIYPYSLKLKIEYKTTPEKLGKNKIVLADKYLTIEIRDKTNPDDCIFFTASPADSKTHFDILAGLEKLVSSKKKASTK